MSKSPIDCAGNVDPKRLDISAKRKRRKAVTREREPLPEVVKPWREAARERKANRPVYPGILLEAQGEVGSVTYGIASPFDDEGGWLDMIADAFGTRSMAVINVFTEHLIHLCRDSYDHSNETWKPSERHLNAAIAIIHASRPKDELDAMLCAQAVAIHWMQMRVTGNLIGGTAGYLDPRSASVCARLSETFVKQVEAIDRRKRKPRIARQVITVKRETHYHQHKHVHLEGGGSEICGQAQEPNEKVIDGHSIERAGEPEGRTALPSPDESGTVVPFSRSPGETGLPQARRRKG